MRVRVSGRGEAEERERTYEMVEGVSREAVTEMVGRKVVAVEARVSGEMGTSGVVC